ncbi:hypothetical protein NDGK_00186 [Clostridiales bacterium CHKCI001]|nr:hypothetical protein NDGK_00186 [Clostridiales bacterium CHKCI001]
MTKVEELIHANKIAELLSKKEDEDKRNKILCIAAIIGLIVAVVGIAYAIHRFLKPDYLEDFEDDLDDDDFDDDFFDDEDDFDDDSEEEDEEETAEEATETATEADKTEEPKKEEK